MELLHREPCQNVTPREWFLFLRRENHMFVLGVFPWRFSPSWRLSLGGWLNLPNCAHLIRPSQPNPPSLQPLLLLSHSPIPHSIIETYTLFISYYLGKGTFRFWEIQLCNRSYLAPPTGKVLHPSVHSLLLECVAANTSICDGIFFLHGISKECWKREL